MGHRVQSDKIVELLRPVTFLALFFLGCANTPDQPLQQPLSGPGDSLVVDSPAVIFFHQDSLRLDGIKAVLRKEVFESLTHDCTFEMRYSRTIVQRDQPSLRVIHSSSNRWLIFQKKNGTRTRIDLNTVNDLCGVVLFDGSKEPLRANMTNIATDLWTYFGKAGE